MLNDTMLLKLDLILGKIEDTISVIALCLLTISTITAIILRYIMGVPNLSGEEISRYLFITVVFLGISICVKESKHLGVTIFVDSLPHKLGNKVKYIASVISTVSFCFIAIMAWIYTKTGIERMQISVATGIPMAIIYAVMAMGLTFAAIRSIMLFYDTYITKNCVLSKQQG